MTSKKIKKVVEELDDIGSDVIIEVLKAMEDDDLYYATLISKKISRTYKHTSKAINRLIELGIIVDKRFYESSMYNNGIRYLGNVRGLVLTPLGKVVRRSYNG